MVGLIDPLDAMEYGLAKAFTRGVERGLRRHPPVPCCPFSLNHVVQVGASEIHQAFRKCGRAQQLHHPPPDCNLGSKGYRNKSNTAGSVNSTNLGSHKDSCF